MFVWGITTPLVLTLYWYIYNPYIGVKANKNIQQEKSDFCFLKLKVYMYVYMFYMLN